MTLTVPFARFSCGNNTKMKYHSVQTLPDSTRVASRPSAEGRYREVLPV